LEGEGAPLLLFVNGKEVLKKQKRKEKAEEEAESMKGVL
jgi:hypothetical protein